MEKKWCSLTLRRDFNLEKKRKLSVKLGTLCLKCQSSVPFIRKAPIIKFMRFDYDLRKLSIKNI